MKKIFTIIGVILAIGFLFLLPHMIKVRVECRNQEGACSEQINAKLKMLNDKSISRAKGGVSKTLKEDPMVSEFSTQFKLPNTLLVNIIAKKPVFAIKDRTSGKIYLISSDGINLSTVDSTDLPVVEQDGTTPNIFALNLLLGVYQMYQVRYGMITNDTLLVDMPGQLRVIFPLEGDRDILLGSLRLVYSKIESDGNKNGYSQIDLRFKNPVLR